MRPRISLRSPRHLAKVKAMGFAIGQPILPTVATAIALCRSPVTVLQRRTPPERGAGRGSIMMTRRSFGTTLMAGAALATGAQGARSQSAGKRTIVDAQVHLWKANSPDWPWQPGAR